MTQATTLMVYPKHRFVKAAFGIACSCCGATFFKAPATRSFYNRCGEVPWYSYDDIPSDTLKTPRQLDKLRLRPRADVRPLGYYYHPIRNGQLCFLYSVADCEPLTLSNKKATALIEKAREQKATTP